MSDFFTRLVERTTGRGTAAQPVITPLAKGAVLEPYPVHRGLEKSGIEMEEEGITITPDPGFVTPVSLQKTGLSVAQSGSQLSKSASVAIGARRYDARSDTFAVDTHRRETASFTEGNNDEAFNDGPAESDALGNYQEQQAFAADAGFNAQVKTAADRLLQGSTVERHRPGANEFNSGASVASDGAEVVLSRVPEHGGPHPELKSVNEGAYAAASYLIRRLRWETSDDLLFDGPAAASTDRGGDTSVDSVILKPPPAEEVLPKRELYRDLPRNPANAQTIHLSHEVPETPTIKVSIGRIEVRAITEPPPQVKRVCSPTPKLSLDDYLKKQPGVKR